MAKVRQDAWSHEDDLLLAETVLRHIREGSTQLNAFEEVGDELNRTSAACGFRWNAEVRNKYIQAIELAKKQRKEKKRAMVTKGSIKTNQYPPELLSQLKNIEQSQLLFSSEKTDDINLTKIITYLERLKDDLSQSYQFKMKSNKLVNENENLLLKVNDLEKQLSVTTRKLNTVENDYQTFIQIMDRARKMTVLEEQQENDVPTFKMDKNGNLEQIIQSHSN